MDAGEGGRGDPEKDVLSEVGGLRVAVVGDALHRPRLEAPALDPAEDHCAPFARHVDLRLDEVQRRVAEWFLGCFPGREQELGDGVIHGKYCGGVDVKRFLEPEPQRHERATSDRDGGELHWRDGESLDRTTDHLDG